MIIRDAKPSDADSILAVYAPFVRDSAISFEAVPPTTSEMATRIRQSTWRWPWLVAELNGSIVGYAYARPFRSRSAYQFTAESTVYVCEDHQRQGVGKHLMQHLLARLLTAGHRSVVAGIALPNHASVALHERLGFEPVGVFPSVGRKFQSWHDVGFWSLALSDRTVAITESARDEWRIRICPATSSEARVLIRELTEDIAARYEHQGDGGSGNFVAEEFDEDRGAFLVGWMNDAPVACGAIRPLDTGVAELKRMYVVPEHRGKRLSSRILKRLELEAVRLGYRMIRLETGNRQPEAIGLYEKSGFRRIACFGRYIDGENSVCYEKPIGESDPTGASTAVDTDSPIVAIHGGFDGGWAWTDVAARLRSFGHIVRTPTLTGSGERAHLATPDINLGTFIDDICNVIRFDDLDEVVLVAHSAGGMVASGVIQRMPERIRHIIFLDALVLQDGESAFDLLGEELAASLENTAAESGCDWKLPHDPPDADRRTDILLRPLKDRIRIENISHSSSYIAFTDTPEDDPFAPVLKRVALRMQSSENCRYREIDLPHFPLLDQPDVVADVIREEIERIDQHA